VDHLRYKMKVVSVAREVCIIMWGILAVLTLSACQNAQQQDFSNGSAQTATSQDERIYTNGTLHTLPTIEAAMADVETIPVYPGSQQVETDTSELPQARTTSFTAAASRESVYKFYLETLPLKGWITKGTGSTTLIMHWSDSSGKVPWRLFLNMSFWAADAQTTVVTAHVSRWPDPNNLPVYPDAQNLTAKDAVDEDGFKDRVLTYSATASPEQVTKFYREMLTQYGWHETDSEQDKSNQGGSFYYGRGDESSARTIGIGSTVTFAVKPENENQVQVEIRVRGTDLRPLP
jgi:Tfp pilus assembly protein PilP